MMNILHVSAGVREVASHSRGFGKQIIDRLRAKHLETTVSRRDLCKLFLPHLTEPFVHAILLTIDKRDAQAREALELSEQLIDEVERADIILVDLPMHNFTIPSTLKTWINYIERPQRTFSSSTSDKIGLLTDRPTFCVMMCGGPVATVRGQPDFCHPLSFARACNHWHSQRRIFYRRQSEER